MSNSTDGQRSADYWEGRADEARMQAENMRDTDARNAMLGIARMYDQLAERAATRERGGSQSGMG